MTTRTYRVEYRYLPEDSGWPVTYNARWRAYSSITYHDYREAEKIAQNNTSWHLKNGINPLTHEYRWSVIPILWLITDTHFGHKGLVTKGYRSPGYEDLIAVNWMKLVCTEDTIYHLGDICLGNAKAMHATYIERMPGHKVLLRGNHDEKTDDWYLRHGWDEVHEAAEVWDGGNRVLLSHYPKHISWGFDYMIFGHLHTDDHRLGDPDVVAAELGPKHKRLALEWMNYSPVTLHDALRGVGGPPQ